MTFDPILWTLCLVGGYAARQSVFHPDLTVRIESCLAACAITAIIHFI